jgi:hypothetical protein
MPVISRLEGWNEFTDLPKRWLGGSVRRSAFQRFLARSTGEGLRAHRAASGAGAEPCYTILETMSAPSTFRVGRAWYRAV